jgi:hypothetical protein
MVLVPIQVSVAALYLPPVLNWLPEKPPPQMIISMPVHIAVWLSRSSGALLVLVAVQLFVVGVYLPPVFTSLEPSNPPQTIISLLVQTAV